jgi:ATP-binding cassette subfamily F protein uup
MAILSFRDVSFQMGGTPLLDSVSFSVEPGERICLTGRNGAGKTTLMRLLVNEHEVDSGEIVRNLSSRIAYLPQEIPDLPGLVSEIIREGTVHHEAEGHWKADIEAERWATQSGLPPEALFSSLSGGQKRRVLLARALSSEPDLLLLDEPTNHLDIDTIAWMEDILLSTRTALLFVTHDRAFLRRISTRILELDRGRMFDWACDWDTFLVRKEAMIEAERSPGRNSTRSSPRRRPGSAAVSRRAGPATKGA